MRRLISIFLPIFLFIACLPSRSQTVDTAINGTVTDSTGAVVPGANVTVTNPLNGQSKSVKTGAAGEYNVNYLLPGTYDMTVTAQGFSTYSQKEVHIDIGQQAKVAVSLQVGGENQLIEVQTTQPLLNTENGTLGAVIGPAMAADIPLNGRKFDDLSVLTPGVTVADPDLHSSSTGGSTVVSNGNQNTWGQVFIDGITMVNNRSPYVNSYPSVDAVQEFSVLTSNYGAQYGGGAGAIVNVQLKSGTNQFHGVVFEYIRNDYVDARNFFRPAPLPKTVLKQNQFGGVISGPIIKDKTFFMFSYEGLRSIQQTVSTTSVLTPAERNGDFSAYSGKLRNPYVLGPGNTTVYYAGNQIPNTASSMVARNIANTYMPLPNLPGTSNGTLNNYSAANTGDLSVNQYLTRVDHKFNSTNQFSIHYLYAGRNFPITGAAPAFSYTGTYLINNAGFQYVHTFSQNLVNELRGGINFEHVKQLPLGFYNSSFTAAQVGINQFTLNGQPLPPSQAGFPTLSISGFLGFGSGTAASNLDYSRTYQLTDNVTWTKGRHTLVMGGDFRYALDNATTNNTPYGSQSFTTAMTGFAAADYILGVPASVITPEGVPLTVARQWRYAFYVQDNWKPTNNLTLNLGLRYDLWLPPHNNLNTSRTLNFNTPTPTLIPLPSPLWQITHKDFAPRIGLAYSMPWQTVIRAAYGITFYGGKFDNINILQLNPPIDSSFSITNFTGPTATNPAVSPPLATIDFPVPSSIQPASANVATLPSPDKRPDLYLQTYTMTVSKQFWSNVLDVSYVGVKGTHQDTSIPYFNSGPPQNGSISAQANRPYPTYGRIRYVDFHGASQYNALQAKYEHRMSHGLNVTASYTYSHLLDNQGGDTNGNRNQTQIPTAKEWASGATDVRHYFTIGVVYQTKFGITNNIEKHLVNGWMLTSLFTYSTGTPLFVTQSNDTENNDNLYQRPDFTPGNNVYTLELPAAQRTLAHWFNTAAFTQAIAHYGNVPRNPTTLRVPSHNPVTLGISRIFQMPFSESQTLMFRFEMFNALNEPQFSAPGATYAPGSSSFGVITSTASDNRDLQLAAKYNF